MLAGIRLLVATTLLCLAPSTVLAERAQGVVFEDLDGDGARGPGDPGLSGVRVSDGHRFATSDADGVWSLEIEAPAIVFVVKPSGFATPHSPDMLPRFYHIHQPEGSPRGLRYPGIAPTGPLPESIDFALHRQEEPASFEAILFADTQPQTEVELDYMRDDVIAELIGTSARFGMTMGDILYDDLSLFPRFNALIGQIGIPWYNVPGNHELNLEAQDDRDSLETYKRYFGPPYYAFDYADVHFVVLDNIDYQGEGKSDPGDYRLDGGYEARIGKAQLRWLERDLAAVPDDRLVFIAMHAPLRTYRGSPEQAQANTRDRRDLFELLAGRPNLYSVAGHTHTTEHHYFGKQDGFSGPGEFHHHVLATVSGSWWSGPIDDRGIGVAEQRDGTPNGYHVLEIDGKDLAVRYKAAGKAADYQMRIVFDVAHHQHRAEILHQFRPGELIDGRMSVDEVPAADVVVNLFDGGPRSRVEMQVGDGAWLPLERTFRFDPFVRELFARHPDVVKPWVAAVESSHLFTGDLPDDLRPGTYTVSVRATDEFGRVHHAHQVIEIEGSSAPAVDGSR